MNTTKKNILKYSFLIFITSVVFYTLYYLTPYNHNYTFTPINHNNPTIIVLSNSNKITNSIINHLKNIQPNKNIVYITTSKISKFERNKLSKYVNHAIINNTLNGYWATYKKAIKWTLVNNKNKEITLTYIDNKTNKLHIPSQEKTSISNTNLSTNPKRYAVFAGYNKNGIIEPYIITYLKGLDEVTDGIVYIADSPLNKGELDKLKDINILYTQHQKHHKYDFGSYAIGYNFLKNNGYLKDTDELIFANDSTYAPLTSFKSMFEEMNKKTNIDFWGTLEATFYIHHICSYFLVFKSQVFNSPFFDEIFNTMPQTLNRDTCMHEYEIQIPFYLKALGKIVDKVTVLVSLPIV